MPGLSTAPTERVRKFELPLSDNCVVVILFDGDDPDTSCFANLREFIGLMETALIGRAKSAPIKKNDLPPCTKHPHVARNTGKKRDCPACLKEHIQKLVAIRKDRT